MLIHGHYYEPEYLAWKNMKARCSNPRWARHYAHVKVCKRWINSYDNFIADVGRRPSVKHSLDRIKSHKGYSPKNVRWATLSVQSRNTKNHCTNKTGIRGVSFREDRGRYRACIYVCNKQIFLGYFETVEAAATARAAAEHKLWRK